MSPQPWNSDGDVLFSWLWHIPELIWRESQLGYSLDPISLMGMSVGRFSWSLTDTGGSRPLQWYHPSLGGAIEEKWAWEQAGKQHSVVSTPVSIWVLFLTFFNDGSLSGCFAVMVFVTATEIKLDDCFAKKSLNNYDLVLCLAFNVTLICDSRK